MSKRPSLGITEQCHSLSLSCTNAVTGPTPYTAEAEYKNSVFLIILAKNAVPSAKYYHHILFDKIHQIDP